MGGNREGVNTERIAWVVILPILYAAGLALLPRQYRQERSAQTGHGVPLTPLSSNSPRTCAAQFDRPAMGAHNANSTGLIPVNDNRDDDVASSNAHREDPYADDVGLTPAGRQNRRSSGAFSLRPTSPRHSNTGGYSGSRSRNGSGGVGAAAMYEAGGHGVSMPSGRF